MKSLQYEQAIRHVRKQILSRTPIEPLFTVQSCSYPAGLESDYHATPHSHSILVLSGKLSFQEERRHVHDCQPGTTLVIPADSAIRWKAEKDSETFHCLHTGFDLKRHGALGTLFGSLQKEIASVDAGMGLVESVERRLALAKLSRFNDVSHSLTALLVMEAAIEAAQSLSQTAIKEKGHSALARCLNHIERNLHKDIRLEELADVSFLGVNRLSQLFRENLGTSPMRHVAKRKAEVAERLLAQGDLGVGEVAERLGFNSISYFSRFFTRMTGRNPSEIINK